MKTTKLKLLLFITTILLTISGVNGQNKITQDSILHNLEQKIATDWDIAISEDTIMIISKIDMYIDFYNIAGAPFNDPEYNKYTPQYLIENGKKTNSTILLIMEPKWTQAKLTQVQNENSIIYNEIESLIYKHKLSHLKKTYRWHEELFGTTTEAEKERIILYRAEKESLLNKIIDIPIYESENYSLFILSRNWRFTEKNSSHLLPMIFPDTENKKIAILEETIDELLKQPLIPTCSIITIVKTLSNENLNILLGKKITVEGTAVDAKLGALLITKDSTSIWINGLDSWPNGYYFGGEKGKTLKVTGTVIEKNDLPIFVPNEGELTKSGVAIPEGTDLNEASHRYLLENAKWEIISE